MSTLALLLTQFVNALSQSALLFFLGVGLTLIFGLMRIVNFAHGALYMLGAFVGYSLSNWSGNYWLALAGAPGVLRGARAAVAISLLPRLCPGEAPASLIGPDRPPLWVWGAVPRCWGRHPPHR